MKSRFAPRCATRPRRSSTPSVTLEADAARCTFWSSCPGEREIRDTAEALNDLKNTEVLPLYARLADRRAAAGFRAAHRPPSRAGHQRRRDVADRAGHPLRRRSGHRADFAVIAVGIDNKLQRLPIEPIFRQASAAPSGRAARDAPHPESASASTPRTTSRRELLPRHPDLEGDRHVGDYRTGTLCRAFRWRADRRSLGGPTPSKSVTAH